MLSDESIKILNQVSFALNTTSDYLEFLEQENTSSDIARGYLKALSQLADDEKVLFVYFLIKNVLTKFE